MQLFLLYAQYILSFQIMPATPYNTFLIGGWYLLTNSIKLNDWSLLLSGTIYQIAVFSGYHFQYMHPIYMLLTYMALSSICVDFNTIAIMKYINIICVSLLAG